MGASSGDRAAPAVSHAVVLLVGAAALFILWRLTNVALLAFGAVIVAVLLRSAATPLIRYTRLGEGTSLLVAGVLILALLGACGWLFGATVTNQVQELVDRLPKSPQELQQLLHRLPLGDDAVAQLTDMGGWASRVEGVAGKVGGYAVTILGALANALVVIVAGVYFAAKPRQARDGVVLLFPQKAVKPMREALDASGRALRLWLLGTFADMAVVGVLTVIGVSLIGLPSPLALGLFAAVVSFVPIVGPIVSVVPAGLLALQEGPQMVLWTILVYIGVQQIESNLVYPFIQRRAVNLPPALTLFGVLAFAALFGPLGVVFATPLLVVAIVMVKLLYVRRGLGKDVSVPGCDDPEESS